jgi:hypothetical protein
MTTACVAGRLPLSEDRAPIPAMPLAATFWTTNPPERVATDAV